MTANGDASTPFGLDRLMGQTNVPADANSNIPVFWECGDSCTATGGRSLMLLSKYNTCQSPGCTSQKDDSRLVTNCVRRPCGTVGTAWPESLMTRWTDADWANHKRSPSMTSTPVYT